MRSNEWGRAFAVVVAAKPTSEATAMVSRAKIQMSHCNWTNLTFLREFFYPLVHRKLLQTTHFFPVHLCALFMYIFRSNFCYSFENDNSGSQAHIDTQQEEASIICRMEMEHSSFCLSPFMPHKQSTISEGKASSLSLSIQSSYFSHCRKLCYFSLTPLATTKHHTNSFHSSMLNKTTSLPNGSHRERSYAHKCNSFDWLVGCCCHRYCCHLV